MRLAKLLLTILVSSLASAAFSQEPTPNVPAVTPGAAMSVPLGSNIEAQRRTVTNNEFTGQLQVQYGLDLPEYIQPRLDWLTIDYTGGSGDGLLGHGWRLSLPSIGRNGRNGINFSEDDYIARLGGGSGELVNMNDGSFRFRREGAFIRWSKLSVNGATLWQALDGQGTKFIFGEGKATRQDPADEKRVSEWLMSSVEDADGFKTVIAYDRVDGDAFPTTITFAPANGTSLFNVKFSYANRGDAFDVFGSGHRVRQARLLKSITLVDGTGDAVQGLAFDQKTDGATERVLLTDIWQTGYRSADRRRLAHLDSAPEGVITSSSRWDAADGLQVPLSKFCVDGDFNADGRADLACDEGTGNWRLRLSSGAKFRSALWAGGPTTGSPVSNQCIGGDFDGDSRSDLACHAGGGTWSAALSKGDGWTTSQWAGGPAGGAPLANSCVGGDFTGDGRTDLACHSGGGTWTLGISSGTGWTAASWAGGPTPPGEMWKACFVGDYNGDGRADIACHSGAAKWTIGLAAANGWSMQIWDSGPVPTAEPGDACLPADFNGDGLTDLACHTGGGTWSVGIATAISFITTSWPSGPAPTGRLPEQCTVGDFNGDHLSDLACLAAGQLVVGYSRGGAWASLAMTAAPAGLSRLDEACRSRDFAGFGGDTLLCLSGADINSLVRQDQFPRLLTKVTNVLGGTSAFTYSSSADTADVRLPFVTPVLAQQVSDVGPGASSTTFEYTGARYNGASREFRGFAKVTVTQPQPVAGPALRIASQYHQGSGLDANQEDPNVIFAATLGQPASRTLTDTNGLLLERRLFTYQAPAATGPSFTPLKLQEIDRCGTSGCAPPYRVEFTYDEYGNITRTVDAGDPGTAVDDREARFTYQNDAPAWRLGQLTSVWKGTPGAASPLELIRYEYGARPAACANASVDEPDRHRLWRVTLGGTDHQSTQSFGYDRFGNVVCVQVGDNQPTLASYDSTGIFRVREMSPEGLVTKLDYYGVTSPSGKGGAPGRLRSTTSPNNVVEQYRYDPFGRIAQKVFGDGSSHSWVYSERTDGRPASVTATLPYKVTEVRTLDGAGQVVRIATSWPSQRAIVESFDYDFAGRLTRHDYPDAEGAAARFSSEFAYDALGRRVRASEQDGRTTIVCFDKLQQIIVHPWGRQQVIISDARGDTQEIREIDGSGGNCNVAGGTYASVRADRDAVGRIIARWNGQMLQTRYRYATSGVLLSEDDADRGTTTFAYGKAGELTARTLGDGRSVFFSYDTSGRMIQKDLNARKVIGSGDYILHYDGAFSNAKGRLRSVESRFASATYEYDVLGRLAQTTHQIGPKKYRVASQYDAMNRVTKESFPDGIDLTYRFDGLRLTSVSGSRGFAATFADYTTLGDARRQTLGRAVLMRSFNGLPGARCATPNYRLCDLEVLDPAGAKLLSLGYGYDVAGNVTTVAAVSAVAPEDPTSTPAVVSATFGFDTQDRLTSAMLTSGAVAYGQNPRGQPNLEVGNLAQFQYPTVRLAAATHAPTSAFGESLVYDGAGRLKKLGARTYEWDADGRLISAGGQVRFDYDADGNLVAETRGPNRVIHLSDAVRCTAAGCEITVAANGQPIGLIGPTGARYLVTDQNRSVIATLNDKGGLERRTAYFPYGEEIQAGDETGRKYLASYFDRTSGTYLFGRRHYSPRLMQFISPDPVDGEEWSFQSGDRYAYALNNPVSRHDPTGLASERSYLRENGPSERSYLGGDKMKEYFDHQREWADRQSERIGRGERMESFREYNSHAGERVKESRYHLIEPDRIRELGTTREIYDPGLETPIFDPLDLIPVGWFAKGAYTAYSIARSGRAIMRMLPELLASGTMKGTVLNVMREEGLAFTKEVLTGAGKVSDYPGAAKTLSNGGFVGYREVGKSGVPAVDVKIPGYERVTKIHYPNE